MYSIDDIVRNYSTIQQISRKRAKSESGRAEAVVFSVLRSQGFATSVLQHSSTGGVDFQCKTAMGNFIVEVTCLKRNTVSKYSGWKERTSSGSYALITFLLRDKVSKKTPQLANSSQPRLLAITTEHEGGGELFSTFAAESLLTSDEKIQVPLQSSESETRIVTDLENSVFFRFLKDDSNGSVEVCRQSISAILLVYIMPDECQIVGILHPQPAVEFRTTTLPTIPFVRVRHWPPKEGKIATEWIPTDPHPARFLYETFASQDQKLCS